MEYLQLKRPAPPSLLIVVVYMFDATAPKSTKPICLDMWDRHVAYQGLEEVVPTPVGSSLTHSSSRKHLFSFAYNSQSKLHRTIGYRKTSDITLIGSFQGPEPAEVAPKMEDILDVHITIGDEDDQ